MSVLLRNSNVASAGSDWGVDAPLEVVRSRKRRSVSVQIHPGNVVVRAPERMPEAVVRAFVEEKIGWINEKLEQHHAAIEAIALPTYQKDAESLLYLGERLKLEYVSEPGWSTMVDSGMLLVRERPDPLGRKREVRRWLRRRAQEYLPHRVEALATATGLKPNSVRVKQYKARWGACYRDRSISLNWLLVHAPEDVIDYVIIHELCHLRHMNHSTRFWDLVGQHCSNYKSHKKWLRTYGAAVLQ